MTINSDFSISAGGDIRHTSGSTIYTVLQLHALLQDLADDASVVSGTEAVSITSPNPSKMDGLRSAIKPASLNLLPPYNIDSTAAQFFNFGSIQQNNGDELYTGLRSIGSPLVTNSPIYIVQNGAKLTSFWPNGHIQILVKAKTSGSFIDSGDIRAYSRKYGQTYSDFACNLVAGSEQNAAISTSTTDWTPLSLSAALALSSNITITVGASTHDTGDGNGSKAYSGTIALSNGATIAQAAQYLQAITSETSTTTINGILGWQFRGLPGFTPNSVAPFGIMAGGKFFCAQGWWIDGAGINDLLKYQLIANDNTVVTNPTLAKITISGLLAGSRILVGRDNGTGGFLDNEYTLSAPTTSGGNTCTVNESIKVDIPTTGFFRVNGIPHVYTSLDRSSKTFTISDTWGVIHASSSPAWVPFIDDVASDVAISSGNYQYVSDFTARIKMRHGSSPNSLQPFESTFPCSASLLNGATALSIPDE